MDKMLNPQSRRSILSRPRPRSILLIVLAVITTYVLVFSGPAPKLHIVPYAPETEHTEGNHHNAADTNTSTGATPNPPSEKPLSDKKKGPKPEDLALKPDPGHHHEEPTGTRAGWDIDIEDLTYWSDPDDKETNDNVLEGYETDGTAREPGDVARLQHEKDLRKMWRYAYKTTAK